MNVFLLAHILSCMSEVVCGEISETVQAWEKELSRWEPECDRERIVEGVKYI